MNGDLHKTLRSKRKSTKVNENSVFAVQEQSFPWLYAGLVAAVLVLWLILLFLWVHKKKKKEKQHDEVISLKTSILLGGIIASLLFFSWQEPVQADTKSSGTITFYDLSPVPHPSGSVNGASKQQTQLPIYKESNQHGVFPETNEEKIRFLYLIIGIELWLLAWLLLWRRKEKEDEHVATK